MSYVSFGVQEPIVATPTISLGSGTVYRVGGCTQYGRYVGNGLQFGTLGTYSVYEKEIPSGYEYALVEDYGCHLHAVYKHATRVTPHVDATATAQPVATKRSSVLEVNPTALYVVGALTLSAVLYFALHKRS